MLSVLASTPFAENTLAALLAANCWLGACELEAGWLDDTITGVGLATLVSAIFGFATTSENELPVGLSDSSVSVFTVFSELSGFLVCSLLLAMVWSFAGFGLSSKAPTCAVFTCVALTCSSLDFSASASSFLVLWALSSAFISRLINAKLQLLRVF